MHEMIKDLMRSLAGGRMSGMPGGGMGMVVDLSGGRMNMLNGIMMPFVTEDDLGDLPGGIKRILGHGIPDSVNTTATYFKTKIMPDNTVTITKTAPCTVMISFDSLHPDVEHMFCCAISHAEDARAKRGLLERLEKEHNYWDLWRKTEPAALINDIRMALPDLHRLDAMSNLEITREETSGCSSGMKCEYKVISHSNGFSMPISEDLGKGLFERQEGIYDIKRYLHVIAEWARRTQDWLSSSEELEMADNLLDRAAIELEKFHPEIFNKWKGEVALGHLLVKETVTTTREIRTAAQAIAYKEEIYASGGPFRAEVLTALNNLIAKENPYDPAVANAIWTKAIEDGRATQAKPKAVKAKKK